jgi:hypothetical protein
VGRRALKIIVTAMVAAATIAPAAAHAPAATRTLRLQLEDGRLQGLLAYHLPAAAAALYTTAPDLAVALAPRAVEGLRIAADGLPLQPKVGEARVRTLPGGALEEVLLLEAGAAKRRLRVAVEAGPPLPIELLAQSAVKLELISGPGAPIRGGLGLRPRPGMPCDVRIARRATQPPPRR